MLKEVVCKQLNSLAVKPNSSVNANLLLMLENCTIYLIPRNFAVDEIHNNRLLVNLTQADVSFH